MHVTSIDETHYFKIFNPSLSALKRAFYDPKMAFYDPKMPILRFFERKSYIYNFMNDLNGLEDVCYFH